MKILSINITEFGGISDFKLELGDGLNIIEGGNESGKSTVLLFIMYMLYGLPKSSRKNTPGAYDKARSLSWANSRAEGSMDIEQGGVRYRIERANLRRTASSEAQITDIDAGTRVHIGKEPGEVFLGVSRETFESCLWCGQSRAAAISPEKLTETLSNLSLTADESVNGEAVMNVIRNAKKQYKHERGEGGLIPELSGRISDARAELGRIDEALARSADDRQRCSALSERLVEIKSRIAALEAEREAARTLKILSRFDALGAFKKSIDKDREALDALGRGGVGRYSPDAEELASLKILGRTYVQKKRDYEASAEEAKTEGGSAYDAGAAELAERIAAKENKESFIARIGDTLGRAKKLFAGGIALIAAACISAIIFKVLAGALSDGILLLIVLLSLSAVSAAVGGVLLALSQKGAKTVRRELEAMGCDKDNYESRVEYCFSQMAIAAANRERAEARKIRLAAAKDALDGAAAQMAETLEKYGRSPDGGAKGLSILTFEVEAYLARKKEISDRITVNARIAENDERQLSGYDRTALEAALPAEKREGISLDENDIERRLREAEGARRATESELMDLEIRIKSSGVSVDTRADREAEIEEMERLRADHIDRYAVLDRAYCAVEEAYGNMRRSFAPSVRDGAGKLLDAISDGRYSRVLLSEDFELGVEVSGKERSANCLSSGTSDALYIALRLSLIENIFEGSVPFFMDETLSQLDDTRAAGVLRLVAEYVADGNQCVLLTCHGRETRLCDEIGLEYAKTEISRRSV